MSADNSRMNNVSEHDSHVPGQQALVLHSVADAEHCVISGLHLGRLLFSTHSSVDVWLRINHNIACSSLSEFCTIEEAKSVKEMAAVEIEKLLETIDAAYAPRINEMLGLQQRYFIPLYTYHCQHHYIAILIYAHCLRRILEQYCISKIIIYNRQLNFLIDTSADMADLMSELMLPCAVTVEIIRRPSDKPDSLYAKCLSTLRRVRISGLRRRLERLKAKCRYAAGMFRGKNVILLLEPLYDLGFLRLKLVTDHGVSYWDGSGCKAIDLPQFKLDLTVLQRSTTEDTAITRHILRVVADDFNANMRNYLAAPVAASKLNESRRISLGIWGLPPTAKANSLLFEYLRSVDVPVIGSQHGCLYGEIHEPWQFVTDFERCDYFFSYGFSADDLKRIYPGRESKASIIPVGKLHKPRVAETAKSVDVLFPLTNSISIFAGGLTRTFPHELTHRQEQILRYLDGLENLEVTIKPFLGASYENCSVMPILAGMKRAHIVANMTLLDYLSIYSPRVVIIEYPSTPLVELLLFDAEIFLLWDQFFQYDQVVREMLERRVHCFDTVEDMLRAVQAFFAGELPVKRDDSYCKRYVYREGSEQIILRTIESICKGEGAVKTVI